MTNKLLFFCFVPILLSLLVQTGCRMQGESYRSINTSFRPGEVWYDADSVPINAHGGGILYHKGTYYWFGEHKTEGTAGNTAQVGFHCYSSKDLYNWKNEGIVLSIAEDDTTHDLAKGCVMERPKVIFNARTGKFVMWFHLELKGSGYRTARSGVAVADRATGPYHYTGSVRPDAGVWPINVTGRDKELVDSLVFKYHFTGGYNPDEPRDVNILGRDFKTGQMARDMTLFVDDDGTAYHIFASEENRTLHISQLSSDYLSHAGKYIRVFEDRYMEAPAIFKYRDKYYFIGSGCTGWAPNAARSAVAESIWGPWTELGNPCLGEDSALTFHSQSTWVLPVAGKEGAFIFMADRWNPDNAIDGRYVWLPVNITEQNIKIPWMNEWDLLYFEPSLASASRGGIVASGEWPSVLTGLRMPEKMGHRIIQTDEAIGSTVAIMFDQASGQWTGANDPKIPHQRGATE